MKVGIIGAGFAGVESARVIAKGGVDVTLFSAEKIPPYFRPRLPEFAFGQENFDNLFFNKLEWYSEHNIELKLDAKVSAFTSKSEVFLENKSQENFDALVIATGANPIIPSFAHENSVKAIFSMWNYSEALEIRKLIKARKQLAVIGGGIIGIESALRAEKSDLNITIIDAMPHLMSRNFDKKTSEVIESQLRGLNMNLLFNNSVNAIDEACHNMISIEIDDKDGFICDFALLTIGSWFDTSIAVEAGLKTDKRILVNEYLETSISGIFAAGDIAQLPLIRPCSAKEAIQQGQIAGRNVLAYLSGKPLQNHEEQPTTHHFKYNDFEINFHGEVIKIGNKEEVIDFESLKLYRNYVYENSALADLQIYDSNRDSIKDQKSFWEKIWERVKNTKVW